MNLLNYKPHNDLKILESDYENVFCNLRYIMFHPCIHIVR